MSSLIALVFQIALRRRGPDALPASRFLLMLTVGAYVLIGGGVLATWDLSAGSRIGLLIMGPLFLLGFTAAVLRLERKQQRLDQTLTALFGLSILFTVLHFVVQFALGPVVDARELAVADGGSTFLDLTLLGLQIIFLVLLVWNVAAIGWVFQRALDKDVVYGTGMAIIYYVTDLVLSQSLVS